MPGQKSQPINLGFNAYETIRHLHTADLIIHTIPGEVWTLSSARHKTLLVDVYTLTGTIAGTRKPQRWQCGLLSELLLRVLWHGRTVQYYRHTSHEQGITAYTRPRLKQTDVLSDAVMPLLRGGDLLFHAIAGESWRLTSTGFGRSLLSGIDLFYLAEERTLGTPELRMYKSTEIECVLLELLCRQSEFVEREVSKVLTFRGRDEA